MAKLMITDIIENPELMNSLDDKQIKWLAYGIKYFDISVGYEGKPTPANAHKTMAKLREILENRTTMSTAHSIETPNMIKCDCGHTICADQVMNASLGTSCFDCYDRMSD